MNSKKIISYGLLAAFLGLGFWGCSGTRPTAPSRVIALTVSVPIPQGLRASLLGASQNELLYNVSIAGSNPVTGMVGPFASSTLAGSINFSVNLPSGGPTHVLAVQLNDGTTHSPLAIGATSLDLSTETQSVTVDMGSVNRSAYLIQISSSFGGTYGFDANSLLDGFFAVGGVYDMSVTGMSGGGYQFVDAQTGSNSIAYMGNDNLVNFASVPGSASFSINSSTSKTTAGASPVSLVAGDVYCVNLHTGGHAWVQVVSASSPVSFRYRANRIFPYYAYDPTSYDGINWSTLTPITATPTATNSPTITVSSTPTNSPTVTDTSTPTNTGTFLSTSTATKTPTSTPTLTPTVIGTPAGIANITGNIDGVPVTGNTSGGQDNYSESVSFSNSVANTGTFVHSNITSLGSYTVYNYGMGAPDVAYQFTLSSPKSLFISLCGASFDTVLYVRTNPNDPSSTINLNDDSNYCGNGGTSSSLVTGSLAAGVTYYVIVDGYQSGEAGTFSLSLSTFNPACALTPVSTPIPEVEPNNDDVQFLNATDLGTVLANMDSVGKGHSSFFLDSADVWHFHAGADGAAYTVSLDCFDDGTGRAIVGFDLYSYDGFSYTLIDSSNDNGEPNQVTDILAAGDYYVAVYAIDSGASEADYHLVVQAGSVPTPTITVTPTITGTPAGTSTDTPTVTETPTVTNSPTNTPSPTVSPTPPTPLDVTSFIDGTPVIGNTTGLQDNYSYNSYGIGAPDIAYQFTLGSPTNLFISLCGSAFDTTLYVRTNPSDPNTTIAFDDDSFGCGRQSNLVTGTLPAGTYYVIVDGFLPSSYGAITLSLTTFNPICSLTPVAAPVTELEPNNDDTTFTNANNLGTVSNGSDAVGVGRVNSTTDYVDVWHFTMGTDMGIDTISLDCFDDGTGKSRVGFDLYDASYNVVGISPDGDPLDQLVQTLPAGDYYVAVWAYDYSAPGGSYRLVVQGGPPSTSPTPTPTVTFTATDTPTLSPTLTVSPTPPVPMNITSSIDGTPVTGDTTSLGDNYNEYIPVDSLTYGSGSPDVAYQFTLSTPKNLYVVANTQFSGVLYLRTNPADPSTTIAFDRYSNSIDSYPALVTGTLPAGTYYVIVDGYGSGNFGTYSLSLSTFNPACALTPVSAPVTEVEPNNDPNFLKTTFLGTVSNGTDAVGKGKVNYYFDNVDNWHFKTGTNGGTYLISLDCFDDGNGKFQVGAQLFNSHHQPVGSIPPAGTLLQYTEFLPTGDYYVKVTASNYGAPSGDYRLVIQGFPPPTATPTPTVTNTPTITPTPVTPISVFGNGQFSYPIGLAVDSSGTTVYVSDYNSHTIKYFTTIDGINYNYVSQWGGFGTDNYHFYNPLGLTNDSLGHVFVVDQNNSRVMEYNSTGTVFVNQYGLFSSTPINGDLVSPQNVAVDGSGYVYVTNDNTNSLYQQVAKYNSSPGPLLNWMSYWNTVAGNPVPNSNPFGIAVNSAGTTVYVNDNSSMITAYKNDGSVIYGQWDGSASGTALSSPRGMAVGPNGNLYVVDQGNNRIVEFDGNGSYVAQMGSYGSLPGQFSSPYSVALDAAGNVYVMDSFNYRVQKFAPF